MPKDLQRLANRVVEAADPDSPPTADDQLQQDRRHLELRQRRDGMWQVEGKLINTVGAQLNAILDPLTRPRTTTIEIDGKTTEIPDERDYGQRMHDAFEDACGRLLHMTDQPAVGGTPAFVIVTVGLEDLLAKAGIAETTDGTQLSANQLLRIADEAEIWPTIIDRHGIPLAIGRKRRIASRGQTMALTAREGGCSFPGVIIHRNGMTDITFWIGVLAAAPTSRISPCSADTTTPTSCSAAGPAASTLMGCRNGYRHAGSTLNNAPRSTPGSDGCKPNGCFNAADVDHQWPHEWLPEPVEGSTRGLRQAPVRAGRRTQTTFKRPDTAAVPAPTPKYFTAA